MDLPEIPIASSLFVLLFGASAIDYLRRRDALAGAVLLIFAASAPIFIARLLDVLFGIQLPPPLTAVFTLALLAQPLFTLRLAAMLHPMRRGVAIGALVGYLVTALPLAWLVAQPAPSPPALAIAALGVYAATAFAAAGYFWLAARRRTGSARVRLAVASGASILMASTLLLAGAAAALPGGSAALSQLARYGIVLAAAAYAAAFMAPGWLRGIWQARTGYDLSRRLILASTEDDPSITWRRFVDLVAAAAGVRHALVAIGDDAHGARVMARMGELAADRSAWDGRQFGELLDQAQQTHQLAADAAGPSIRALLGAAPVRYVTLVRFDAGHDGMGLLVLAGERRSLFTRDDREIFALLGVEAALLADRARTMSEHAELAARLTTTVDALRAANRAKSDFLASMSHELRTPLNAIMGFSDLMRNEPEVDGRRTVPAPWIDHVRIAGQHLLGLINDVLDLAKVEAGRLELQMETIDPASAVSDALEELRPLALQKRLSVSSEVAIPTLTADRGRLRQVLYNLLANAIKFTPEGGEVRIEGVVDHSYARIAVVDTGVGIAAEDRERIFDEFTQVGDPGTRQSGTGLGLALTSRLVEAHGGHIELESRVGVGSRFTIVIPLQPAAGLLAANLPADIPPRAASLDNVPSSSDAGRPVLVIEDDEQAVALLRSYLEDDGYAIRAVRDGAEGIAAARRHRPAAVLLDVQLPGWDGWEVLRRLKADPELADLPVLMVTVVDEKEIGLALGAVDYLVKPVERNALLAALRRHAPGADNGRRRVLAADDDPAALAFVQATLESQGYEVVLANGGREAVYAANDGRFDVVICDLVMPDLDGFEVVAQLKAAERTRDIPILILTAHSLDEDAKARLNGKIIGICEKGQDAAGHLRTWLAAVAPPARSLEGAA